MYALYADVIFESQAFGVWNRQTLLLDANFLEALVAAQWAQEADDRYYAR